MLEPQISPFLSFLDLQRLFEVQELANFVDVLFEAMRFLEKL